MIAAIFSPAVDLALVLAGFPLAIIAVLVLGLCRSAAEGDRINAEAQERAARAALRPPRDLVVVGSDDGMDAGWREWALAEFRRTGTWPL